MGSEISQVVPKGLKTQSFGPPRSVPGTDKRSHDRPKHPEIRFWLILGPSGHLLPICTVSFWLHFSIHIIIIIIEAIKIDRTRATLTTSSSWHFGMPFPRFRFFLRFVLLFGIPFWIYVCISPFYLFVQSPFGSISACTPRTFDIHSSPQCFRYIYIYVIICILYNK